MINFEKENERNARESEREHLHEYRLEYNRINGQRSDCEGEIAITPVRVREQRNKFSIC